MKWQIYNYRIVNQLNRSNKKARTSFREMRSSIFVSYSVAQTVYVNEVRRARRDAIDQIDPLIVTLSFSLCRINLFKKKRGASQQYPSS